MKTFRHLTHATALHQYSPLNFRHPGTMKNYSPRLVSAIKERHLLQLTHKDSSLASDGTDVAGIRLDDNFGQVFPTGRLETTTSLVQVRHFRDISSLLKDAVEDSPFGNIFRPMSMANLEPHPTNFFRGSESIRLACLHRAAIIVASTRAVTHIFFF